MTVKPSHIKALLGLLLILLTLSGLSIFRQQILNNLVYFTLVVLLALGVGILTYFLSGKATGTTDYNNQKVKISIKTTSGFFAFVLVLALGIYFYFKTNLTFDYIVYLRDKQQQTVLKNQGALQILLNNTPRVESVDQYGRVVISGIPSELRETAVRAELINSSDWSFDNRTKTDTFSLIGKDATLFLVPDQDLCCIRGTVTAGESGPGLPKVTVWVSQLLPVTTDSLGRFILRLPSSRQNGESVRVSARLGQHSTSVYATARQEAMISLPIQP